MTAPSPVDMDAILDAALDELDEDSVGSNRRTHTSGDGEGNSDDAETKTEDHINPLDATAPPSFTAAPSRIQESDNLPHEPNNVFRQMLREFIRAEDDDDDGDNQDMEDLPDNDEQIEQEKLGRFMQQVQSQLDAATRSKAQSTTDSKSSSTKKKKNTSNRNTSANQTSMDQVQQSLAAILDEMAKARVMEDPEMPDDIGDLNGPSSLSDEEKLLQGIFQSLGANMDGGDNTSDPSNFNPDAFVDGMMEQLLSKELMYEPMKQVTEKFPAWLEQHKDDLDGQELKQRQEQYRCFQELVQVYESQEDGNTDNVDTTKSTGRLMELMQRVQEFGQPPQEIVNEIAPGLELDEEGLPKMDGMPPLGPNGEECRLM